MSTTDFVLSVSVKSGAVGQPVKGALPTSQLDTPVGVNFFNLLNYGNLADPISNFNAIPSSGGAIDPNTGQVITPGDLGRILSTSNNARIIQLALKFNF